MSEVGTDVLIPWDGADTITLKNVMVADLNADDFTFF